MSRLSALRHFRRLGFRRQLVIVEATAALAAAAAAIAFLPFRKAVKLGSRPMPSTRSRIHGASVEEICWSVEAVARRVPWRAMCFERGLAAQWMLRRRGHDAKLVYGARLADRDGLDAHVWVTLADRILIGGEQAEEFQRLATLPEWSH
jgi:hypothetical protein